MVYSSSDADRRTYLLWRRFSMPVGNGTKDAIAVEKGIADELNSAYTFLLEHIVLLAWGILVVVAILISIRRYAKETHPRHISFTTEIWNNRASPLQILTVTGKKLLARGDTVFLVIIWVFLALSFVVVKYAVPIYFARFIIIDHAAPVDPEAVYFPSYRQIVGAQQDLTAYALEVPLAVRAAGLIDQVKNDPKHNSSVWISDPQTLAPLSANQAMIRIDYGYSVSGVDFGLQHYPDLFLNVNGSCVTEYSWWSSYRYASNISSDYVDTYHPFNNVKLTQQVDLYDGGKPMAHFWSGYPSSIGAPGNYTWAAFISSTNRTSYWQGTDPWYLTGNPRGTGNSASYLVEPRRPALSCWQNDVWIYKDRTSTVAALNSTYLPGLDLPLPIQTIFAHFLGQPKIVTLGTSLGSSALDSASNNLGFIFNASSSSIHQDLTRLVFASYIATANTLTETTLFGSGSSLIPNGILDSQGNIGDRVGDFVVWSAEVSTLDVKALIIIPVITLVLFIFFIGLMMSPVPGKEVGKLTIIVENTDDDPKAKSDALGGVLDTAVDKLNSMISESPV